MRSLRATPPPLRLLVSACAALLLGTAHAACEPRIEEPLPPAHSGEVLGLPARGTSAAHPTDAETHAAAGRCIRPTPAAPARALARDGGADPACPDDPTGPFKLHRGKVIFLEAKAPDVLAEITRSDEERARGLMYRKSMPENHGMIFVFEERRNHSFWMHNTCIPLDMLFIDSDGTIVGIEENTPTLNDSNFQVGCPSTYVLELNAGWARRHGVVAGQKVRLEGV